MTYRWQSVPYEGVPVNTILQFAGPMPQTDDRRALNEWRSKAARITRAIAGLHRMPVNIKVNTFAKRLLKRFKAKRSYKTIWKRQLHGRLTRRTY